MLIKVCGSAVIGVDAETITVEVNVDRGVGYHLVGLPDNAIKESNYRISAALQNRGYKIPGKRVTINMAPADMRKEGSAYDLSIATGILAASHQMQSENIERYIIMGELSLNGDLQPIKGALPIAVQARKEGFEGFILPEQNAEEAATVNDLKVYGVKNIQQVIDFFDKKKELKPTVVDTRALFYESDHDCQPDFSDIKGQEGVKRCMEIAASGGHNIILIGPPGSGKTMIAKRLAGILPPMTLQEALETTKIHSVVGKISERGLIHKRPFRAPHHTISDVALVGGGSFPTPGEISLCHNGVLFLDELPEFKRSVLEVMRQPLEDRQVTISRSKYTITYPSSFMLVASMNPSPGGYFNDDNAPVKSSNAEMQRYLSKVSGPLLDRIDLHIEVAPVPFEKLSDKKKSEKSEAVRARVIKARKRQTERFKSSSHIHYNAQMDTGQIDQYCSISAEAGDMLKFSMQRLNLSARAYDRILKVSRTIADIEGLEQISTANVAEAIQYRSLDRENWFDQC